MKTRPGQGPSFRVKMVRNFTKEIGSILRSHFPGELIMGKSLDRNFWWYWESQISVNSHSRKYLGLWESWHSLLLVERFGKRPAWWVFVVVVCVFSALCVGVVASKYSNLWKWSIRENSVSVSFCVLPG